MTELARLSQTGSPLTRELFRAGREELPSERVAARTMQTLGLVAGGAAVLTTAVPASSAAVGTVLVAKWASMGILAGAVAAGSVVGVRRLAVKPEGLAPSVPAAVTPPSSARHAVEPMAQVGDDAPSPESTKPRLRAAPPAGVSLSPAIEDPLAREVAVLDKARSALRRGDLGAARRALDAYEAEQGHGALRPEALYLRMETLLRAGERSTAAAVARQLLRAYPGSTPAARARELVGPGIQ